MYVLAPSSYIPWTPVHLQRRRGKFRDLEPTTTDEDSADGGGETSIDKFAKERKLRRVVSNSLEAKLHGEDYGSDKGGWREQGRSEPSHNQSHGHQHHRARAPGLHHDSEVAIHQGPRHRPHNGLLQREDAKKLKLSATQYDFAICKLQPNTAIAKELQQPVTGLISLWQQIHAGMDDLGRNPDNPASVSSGDSGPRVACCIIEKVDKLPQLSSKAARRILRDIMQPFSDFESE
ncbi:hypothetical protein HPB51_018802 [Rhipicephalus microplus]|uniref:Uncharacterized protein n=1 Tax=Rhipicephalus microplus TaxID=6941 RepID=A0A9J6DJA1_RHIMP|nr:hypothetical protein HPB51_018802 [Rhipicephalus microplus]